MDVLMPQLGETVTEGTVSAWHKKVGDPVTADDILLDIETDKVSMEVPSPGKGTLSQILVEAGETVDVGTLLAVVLAEGESASPGAGARESGSSADADATAPARAEPAPGPKVAPVEVAPVAAEFAGVSPPSATAHGNQMRLSPAVRRLAAEHEIELSVIDGSGRNGRITRRDVIDYLSRQDRGTPQAAAPQAAAPLRAVPSGPPAAEPAPSIAGKTIPFDRVRKRTAEHMVRSKATSPHVLQAVEVDFSGVDRVRAALRESWKAQRGYSLTYLPFIAHAVCRALAEYPHVNASVVGESLVVHEHVNLAIAVDLGPGGLVAPVIREAERASVSQLAQSINDIAQRARDQRLKPDDLSGGTYTLSNSGTFGTLITAPIINQPQVAILSTDGVRKKPVVIESSAGDAIAIRPIGILAQSFDHRAFDGAYSAAFLDRTRKIIEQSDWFREV
jgi:pyruvate dehydrogenase E2 component (dihydrolipoyllysine-residue acetyltransferase)